MSRFDPVFEELKQLQCHLSETVNRLWSIRSALSSSYRRGHTEKDFLPRRLVFLKREQQIRFEQLLYQLNHLISTELDSAFLTFSSSEDVEKVIHIRRTILYIRNAFANELPLIHTLDRLNSALPLGARN